MKKLASLLLAVLLVLGSLLPAAADGVPGRASGEDAPGFEVPAEFDTSRDYEIVFWAKNDTNKAQVDIYNKAAEDFHALYPNVTVKIKLYTDYARIYNDVITNIATDTTPNVCITYPDHIATYLTGADTMAQLDALMADPRYGLGGSEVRFDSVRVDEMVPEFLAECLISGHYYALPYMRSTEACYVNKTFVEKLGYELPETLTWDFVWEVSEAAMAKDVSGKFAVNGQEVLIPFIYKSTDNMMISMLKQLDAPYSTENGDILLFSQTAKDLLFEISEHAGTRAFSTFKISSYPANFLNAGQCIFAIDSTAGATWMGSDAPLSDISRDQYVDFETAVMTIPQFDPENPWMISQGPSVCVFNKKDPQEVLASWLFAQFLLTDGVQIAYSETEGYVPVTRKAQQSAEYQAYLADEGKDAAHYDVKIKAAKLLLDNTERTFVTPVFNGSASLRDAAGQLIEEVTKSMRRKETVNDRYMRTLFSDIKSLYRLEKGDLGPLPGTAQALLWSLAGAWMLIGFFYFRGVIRKKKENGQNS